MKWILFSALLFTNFFVYGQNAGGFEFIINENEGSRTITLRRYRGREQNLAIPEQINGIPVTSIGGDWYFDFEISSIYLPKTITSISSNVFTQWHNLSVINVDGGNPVYYSANGILFGKDNSIVHYPSAKKETSYVIPNGITKIGDDAFSHNNILTTVILPAGLKEIGNHAFYGSKNITSIDLPNSLEEIGMYAFYECSKLEIQFIPPSVKEIGYGAFYGCDLLSPIIRKNIESIGNWAFYEGR